MEETRVLQETRPEAQAMNESERMEETHDEMLSRHRKEITELQKKEIEMKKSAGRGSKAEQKAKKKHVEEEISQLTAKLKEKQAEELSLHLKMAETQLLQEESPLEARTMNESEKKEATRDEMLSRHRNEITELQNKETEMKKTAARGSKAEQKAKLKQVEEEITQLSARLKEKQAEELASLGYISNSIGNEKNTLDTLVRAIAGVSVSNQTEHSKPSKGTKIRQKRAQKEAAREQRIEEEQNNIVSDRFIENEKLQKKLAPLGFTVKDIKPDGHCLYRAVENQLSLLSGGSSPYTYENLRKIVADYMRKHTSDFLPFFLSENMKEAGSKESMAEKFEEYCNEVESTAAWGGQLELEALTHCLKKHIMIFSGSFPDVEMGKEYKSDDSEPSIMLSYHKHAFGLGEHYNSVVPNLIR